MYKDKISNAIQKATRLDNFTVEFPADISHGDYSTNVALINAKSVDTSPVEYAKDLVEKLNKDNDLNSFISKIEIAGPGFINFWLSDKALMNMLFESALPKIDHNQKLMLEYAHPNTHKAFHIGHLLNIITGESLAKLWEEVGHEVIRVNYQGDVGMHIAKALYGLMNMDYQDPVDPAKRAELLAKAYVLGNKSYEDDNEAKKNINNINRKIYSREDTNINKLYDETRGWSLEYFDTIYARLGTKYDRLYFESEVFAAGVQKVNEALDKGILERSDGAIVYKGEKDGLHTRVFLTKDGNPTYEGKDLGLAKFQSEEYHPDLIVHLVGKEQTDYFKVIFRVIEQLYPKLKDKEYHQTYGWVSLKGGKMSSRKGNVVLGMWLLDEVKHKIIDDYSDMDDKRAEQIAQAAVKYAFLKNSIQQDIAFDLKESISLEGNSGPYLQYSVVRAKSVLSKSGVDVDSIKLEQNIKIGETEKVLMRKLSQFNEIIVNAANSYSPSTLATYLYDLASDFNGFYNSNKIIGSEEQDLRLVITKKFIDTVGKGLELLGIQVPDRM